MKTYEFTLKHDGGSVTIRASASDLKTAQGIALNVECAPESAIQSWRVVPTKRQIARTKSLLRMI